MKKNDERLEHGLHNESVCEYLRLKEEFADWVITTAFYSSLHFVSYKIFPFSVKAIEGKDTIMDTLDQYFNYKRALSTKPISKHELLADLVEKNCSQEVSECYDWLLSTAHTARYHNYQHPKEVANRAMSYLKQIKKNCK